jgi:hypothetical protein
MAPMTTAQHLYARAGFVRVPERDRHGEGFSLIAYVLEL